MSERGSQASVDDIYTERNQAVAVLVKLASRLGYEVGVMHNDHDPDWPVVYVQLPQGGQVSWHIPLTQLRAYFPTTLPTYATSPWDGHDRAEKAKRLLREVRGS